MRIWKWTLTVTDLQSLPIPEGAKLLAVQAQGDIPQLWALVNEKAQIEHRNFAIYGTGNPMPDGDPGEYVGTYQIRGGALVFHVFERRKSGSATDRLHNLCEGIADHADGSEWSREEWRRIDAENSALTTERDALRRFAQKVMQSWPEGDVDGGELQDIAESCGLLAGWYVIESCGDGCQCEDFPTTCYRRTPLLNGEQS